MLSYPKLWLRYRFYVIWKCFTEEYAEGQPVWTI